MKDNHPNKIPAVQDAFSEPEQAIKHKIVFLNSVFLLAGLVAFSLAFVRIPSNLPLGVIDFVFAALNFALLAYLNRRREKVEAVASIALALSFLLFFAIYLLAPANPTRLSLFFLLSASALFLKGRRVGRLWLAFIILSILAGYFVPAFKTGYSLLDTLTTCVYLFALLVIFENYETFKENQQREQEALRNSARQAHELNEGLEIKVQERTRQLLAARDELVRKEKLAVLGQVAGSVGHELRNPLGVMNNAVYFLQTVLPNADATTREYLDIIKDEIAVSEHIVSDLLDAVRTKPPRPEAVGLAELIGQTLRKCNAPPSVAVKLDIPTRLPPLLADPLQLHQVFRNLVSNAVEAMPDGGTLEISAAENKQEGTIAVSIKDSGAGIAPEMMSKLFQPLFTTKARGIGLGLVVVKNLVQANGGSVRVESEPGKGSTFFVTLPTQEATSGSRSE